MVTTSDNTEINSKDYTLVSTLLCKGLFSDKEYKVAMKHISDYRLLIGEVSRLVLKYGIDIYTTFEEDYCLTRWKCTPNCLDLYQHKEVLASYLLQYIDEERYASSTPAAIQALVMNKDKCISFSY